MRRRRGDPDAGGSVAPPPVKRSPPPVDEEGRTGVPEAPAVLRGGTVQAERSHEELAVSERTLADVSTLMVELGRAFKGWSFYPPDHPARAEVLDRAWRAWQGDLRRNGPLTLEIRRGSFWLPGAETPISARADDTARQLHLRDVHRLVFDDALDAQTLAGFLDTLTADAETLRAQGGFAEIFYAAGHRRGVQVNDVDWRTRLLAAPPEPEPDLGDEPVFLTDDPLPGAAGTDDEDLDPLLPAPFEAVMAEPAAPAAEEPEHTQPVAAFDPASARDHELETLLSQLEECEDDESYRELARHLAALAERMVGEGQLDGGLRVLVRLAHHTGDDAKRSFAQRESADGFLGQLARGALLDRLIERAVDASATASLEATAALRVLGARVAAVVLDRLEQESDPERRGRLAGVMIAMGDEAVPVLVDAMVQGSKRRMRTAVRLAGETQNPRLVACLREVLLSGESEVSREAARALVRVGDVTSLDVLAEALHSVRPEVTALAAYSLGSTGRVLAVAPLQDALIRALDRGDLALAREVVRALGRLARPEAAPALVAVLERGGLFTRRKLREVQLAAVAALGQTPGPEAEAALERLVRGRDARLREAAIAALRRTPPARGGARRREAG